MQYFEVSVANSINDAQTFSTGSLWLEVTSAIYLPTTVKEGKWSIAKKSWLFSKGVSSVQLLFFGLWNCQTFSLQSFDSCCTSTHNTSSLHASKVFRHKNSVGDFFIEHYNPLTWHPNTHKLITNIIPLTLQWLRNIWKDIQSISINKVSNERFQNRPLVLRNV